MLAAQNDHDDVVNPLVDYSETRQNDRNHQKTQHFSRPVW